MKRAIVIVIDGLGVGALPDAGDFGDPPGCNSLMNVAEANGGLALSNLGRMGLGNIIPVEGVAPTKCPTAQHGRMMEVAKGKDSTTGHWELAGFTVDKPFQTFPDGFPSEFLAKFLSRIECEGFYGNCTASGTDVIERHHHQHVRTGWPIVYTSADSVFQITCDVDTVPLKQLYQWCETARTMLDEEYNVSRVIARPYRQTASGFERLHADRRDFAIPPWCPTMLNRISGRNGRVIGIGKIADLFVNSGLTHSVHTRDNDEGIALTAKALDGRLDLVETSIRETSGDADCELIFTNLVDTDSKYGHRRDPSGYAIALERIDQNLPDLLQRIGSDDLLIITSDHGCDPTASGSDHTREYVPLLVYNSSLPACDLGTIPSFTYVSRLVEDWLIPQAS